MPNEELAKTEGMPVTTLATGLLDAGRFIEYLKSIPQKTIETTNPEITEEQLRKILGTRVKAMRQLRGLKQAELGRRIGATQSFVTNLENGRRGASLSNLVALGQTLNVSIDWLLDAAPLKPE